MYAFLSAEEMNKHAGLSLFHSMFCVSKSRKDLSCGELCYLHEENELMSQSRVRFMNTLIDMHSP